MKRPIAISLAPNIERKDILLAFGMLFSPFRYLRGSSVRVLEQWFRQYFFVSYAISFVSGRCALLAILKALDIKKGDEVIVQAFTCVAVVNPILDLFAIPVYVDIDNTLTIDPVELEKKITKKTKAIIVQHTFGIPADLGKIVQLAKKHKIPVIEDCAHTIGGTYKQKKLGTFGTAAFFSFGRDKAFSSVFGGMATTNNEALGKKLRAFQKNLPFPSLWWIIQQLFHPIAFAVILPLYNIYIGKVILVLLQKLHFLSFPVSQREKKGKQGAVIAKKMPNALAELAVSQVKRIKEYNAKREYYTTKYTNALVSSSLLYTHTAPLLRFPIVSKKRDVFLEAAKKEGIYFGNWYANVIDPKGTDLKNIYYQKGSCPKAEQIAQQILNLPTYPTLKEKEIEKVIELVKKYQ